MMKKLIHILGIAFLFASGASYADTDMYYAPIIIAYMNGDFLSLTQVAMPIKGKSECIEQLQHLITNAQEKGGIPAGGSVIGGCVPVPPAPAATT